MVERTPFVGSADGDTCADKGAAHASACDVKEKLCYNGIALDTETEAANAGADMDTVRGHAVNAAAEREIARAAQEKLCYIALAMMDIIGM